VSDNGRGIPQDIRSRIFEPFFTTKPMGSGTGVGLSLSHAIVSAHNGSLRHETPAEGGARFVVELPLLTTTNDTAGPVPASSDPGAQPDALSILIVDDEPNVAEIIHEILQHEGHHTMIANSGRQALERIADNTFDAILSDLQMPDINGPELYQRLQHEAPALCERIAFITGDTLGASAQKFLREAGRPCLEKPFTPEEVLRLIDAITDS
jgi:CheY-like chemotaxis protein